MPLQSRRPNLPKITLPEEIQQNSVSTLKEDVHTPVPFTPVPYAQGALVMTPDTPHFSHASNASAGKREREQAVSEPPTEEWTEDEDGVLQSYLLHPPRPLATTYPPGSLPPPGAIDEIASQVLDRQETWIHSWTSIRQRLFDVARRASRESIGGVREKDRKPARPTLSVLGQGMSRQQHSMDGLLGDDLTVGFSEALR
ncbi:hypothetical protein P7C73_g3927, partial [Tremellales sp. Uapishka_1]